MDVMHDTGRTSRLFLVHFVLQIAAEKSLETDHIIARERFPKLRRLILSIVDCVSSSGWTLSRECE